MNYIKAKYSLRHTTGESVWDLDQLNIDVKDIQDFEVKWNKLTVWFFDDEREAETFLPNILCASIYDEINGHEYIKHPNKITKNFRLTEKAE